MNDQDLAQFEHWLENYATDEERALPYEKQTENFVLWLSGENDGSCLENIRPEDLNGSH